MGRLGRRRFTLLVAVVGASITSACLSPTLPLPPPSEPEVSRIDDGHYRLTGTIPLPGQVFAQNTRTELVFGQSTPRAYDFVVEARRGDVMTLWYLTGTTVSDFVEFEIEGDERRIDAQKDGGEPGATRDAGGESDAGESDASGDAGRTP